MILSSILWGRTIYTFFLAPVKESMQSNMSAFLYSFIWLANANAGNISGDVCYLCILLLNLVFMLTRPVVPPSSGLVWNTGVSERLLMGVPGDARVRALCWKSPKSFYTVIRVIFASLLVRANQAWMLGGVSFILGKMLKFDLSKQEAHSPYRRKSFKIL